MRRRILLAAVLIVAGACAGGSAAQTPQVVHPSLDDALAPVLHPTVDDALAQGFDLVVGRAPFVARLWVDNADGYRAHWDLDGEGATDAPGSRPRQVRFARAGIFHPGVTLSAAGRPDVRLVTRIVVLDAEPLSVPEGRFGVNEDLAADPPQQLAQELALMKAAGVDWLRLPLRWFWLEPQRGRYRWDRSDGVVQRADEAGLRLLAVLGGTPRWSSGLDAATRGRGAPSDAFAPLDTRDFAAYVWRVVDRYRGQIAAYELLNEPNSPDHWAPVPNAARFGELLCAGYLAAKYADPQSAIVLGGLNGNGLDLGYETPEARDFLKAIYAGPAARCFDVLAIHPFAHPLEDGGKVLQTWIDATRHYMAERGDHRPLWVTEIGWSTGASLWGHAPVTEEQQAEWVRVVYERINGPQKVFWYNFKENRPDPTDPEHQWGWVRYDLQPKPAYHAFSDLKR